MRIHWVKLDKVHSTNSYLADLIRNNEAEEGFAVVADYQDTGKGQGSSRWHSGRGENLLMSVALFPAFLSASRQFHISRIASLAICDFLEPLGLKVHIKWPNDILTGRGKISGILIENSIKGQKISHSVVGIGLNLNQKDFPDFPVRATSLVMEKGIITEPFHVAETVSGRLAYRYNMLKNRNIDT